MKQNKKIQDGKLLAQIQGHKKDKHKRKSTKDGFSHHQHRHWMTTKGWHVSSGFGLFSASNVKLLGESNKKVAINELV